MFRKLTKHIKNKSLLKVSRNYVRKNLFLKLFPAKKQAPENPKILTRVTESREEAIEFLVQRISEITRPGRPSLMISSFDDVSDGITRGLIARKVEFLEINYSNFPHNIPLEKPSYSSVFTSFLDAGTIHKIGSWLLENPACMHIPFEYVCIPGPEYSSLLKYDQYNKFSFVSPLLSSEIDFNSLYAESIEKFKLDTPWFRYTAKCDVRDFMDLVQILENLVRNDIPGDIAEFGSYKGHSGYLMTGVLNKLHSDKKVYMFDAFEEFPSEGMGIDSFWSNTHKVDFEEVKQTMSIRENAILVKGDFTKTLPETGIDKLCFAYVDCDSYRATVFLCRHIFENLLSPGGIMVFEDYGHPALLGNRLAVHEFFDKRKDCFRFFSQFSGYYVVVKHS